MTGGTGVLLSRPRLHARLDRSDQRLTVVAAPSGFGKTSLVRCWVTAAAPAGPIWVTLSHDVVSRTAFWQGVVTSAARLGMVPSERTPGLLAELERTTDPAAVIARGVFDQESHVMVIDAYERLREMTADVDADLVRLTQLASGAKVVVTSRSGSGLASPGRSLRGDVQLLTADDLTFTPAETSALLTSFGIDPDPDLVTRLHHSTGGYPLALRAAMLGSEQALAAGDVTAIDPLHWQGLVAEDLRTQLGRRDLHDFVLATCVPPYFDVDLATDLTGHGEVKALLDDLEWNGFGRWIPFRPGHPVFQYVDALREAMLVEAARASRAVQRRRAEASALWLHRNGSHEAALAVAVPAGLFGIAARVYAALIVTNQDAVTSSLFDVHLAAVPSHALVQFPALAFGRGLACHRDPALRSAAADYFRISAAWDGPRIPDPSAGEVLLGHVSKVVSLRLLGRFEESLQASREALGQYDALQDPDLDQLADLRPLTLRHLAYSQFQGGDLTLARTTTARAVAAAGRPEARNHTAVYAAGLSAWEGRSDEARSAAALVTPEAWRPGDTHSYLNALGRIGQATLSLDALDFAGALATYDGCESFIDTSEFWPFITWTLMHARLGMGDSASEALRVEEQLRRAPLPPGMGSSLGAAAVHAGLAVLWLAAGRRAKAAPLLRGRTRHPGQLAPAVLLQQLLAGDPTQALHLLPVLEEHRGHTLRSVAALLTIGAATAVRAGRTDTAAALLERVSAMTGPAGPRIHLAYLPAADVAALRDLAEQLGQPGLRTYLAGPVPDAVPAGTPTISLTRQERAVVAAMVHHTTRAQVATALHVTENTVKTHLQRIYRKLGVHSRAAVIERAIELDLLDRP